MTSYAKRIAGGGWRSAVNKSKKKLKAYTVELTREVRYVATIDVEAFSEEEAIAKAETEADSPSSRSWVEDSVISQDAEVSELAEREGAKP